jgi:hypothetical protein
MPGFTVWKFDSASGADEQDARLGAAFEDEAHAER